MIRLVYVSMADQALNQDGLLELVQRAAVANRRDDITGLLLFNRRNFLQLLEGRSGRVSGLMARIRADHRHHGVSIIAQRRVDAPACGSWGMRLLALDEDIGRRKDELAGLVPQKLDEEFRRMIVNFAGLD